jgi:hypothetical protein
VIPSILAKVDKTEILRHYRIANFDSVDKLLELVAHKKGFINSIEREKHVSEQPKQKKK